MEGNSGGEAKGETTEGELRTPGTRESSSASFPPIEGVLDRALAIVAFLRENCPWDRKQTSNSLLPHLIEEAGEVVEAVAAGRPAALRDEIGDLLLNLAFQIVIAEEEGHFTRTEVLDTLEAKMVRRHPHLFGGAPEPWEAIKARERAAERGEADSEGAPSALEGVPSELDPLLQAHRIQGRAAAVGFDWPDPSGAVAKVREEIDEVAAASEAGGVAAIEEEIGDLLFAVVNVARLSGVHAVGALAAANAKFRRRFVAVEALARERGVPIPGATLAEMDALWDEVKRSES